MQIIVTGATGFIGKRLCKKLSEAGHVITGLTRDASTASREVSYVDRFVEWDPAKSDPSPEVFSGADAVVHLAGESVVGLWTASKKRSIRESRVEGTRRLVSALEKTPLRPGVLVCASGVGFYGDQGDTTLDENSSPRGGDFLSEVCQAWEREAHGATALGMRVVPLRIGLVLGLDGGMLEPLVPAARLGLFGRMGGGAQWWPWVHIDDVARLIVFALENEVHGPLNATAPHPARQADFARTLTAALGRRSLVNMPRFALRLLGGIASEVLNSKRVLPEKSLAEGFRFAYPELSGALDAILSRDKNDMKREKASAVDSTLHEQSATNTRNAA